MKVLVVEDDQRQRDLLSEYLRMANHEVDLAANGREALRWFGRESYVLVITDRAMPGAGGDCVAREIKKRGAPHTGRHAHRVRHHDGGRRGRSGRR